MRGRGWIFSAILHAVVIALAAFGVPHLFEPEPPAEPEPIVVGLVEIAEQASAPAPKPAPPAPPPAPKPAPKKVEPEPKPEKPLPEAKEKAPEPTPPPPEPAPKPVVKSEPEPVPEPPPPEPKLEPTPEETPEPPPEPKPEEKVEPEPKPVEAPKPPPKPKPPADLNSLLKNLAPDEPKPPAKEVQKDAEKPQPQLSELLESVAAAPEDAASPDEQTRPESAPSLTGPLAATIAGAIRRKVEENWSVPAGVEGAANLLVSLTLELAPDGGVLSVQITDYARYSVDTAYRAMTDSAKRAVLKASPFDILREHADKYDQWRVITMTFRPPV